MPRTQELLETVKSLHVTENNTKVMRTKINTQKEKKLNRFYSSSWQASPTHLFLEEAIANNVPGRIIEPGPVIVRNLSL